MDLRDPSNAKPSSSEQAPFLKPTPHSRSVSVRLPLRLSLNLINRFPERKNNQEKTGLSFIPWDCCCNMRFLLQRVNVLFIYICNFKHVFCFGVFFVCLQLEMVKFQTATTWKMLWRELSYQSSGRQIWMVSRVLSCGGDC